MAEQDASAKPRGRSKSKKSTPPVTAPPEPVVRVKSASSPAPVPDPVVASPPKRKATESAARELPTKTSRRVVDLDAEPEVKSEAKMRFFTCHNHHTAFGSGHACTLVCAPDVLSAQTALDGWLVTRELKPLHAFPYQLHEIDCAMRRAVVVSPDDAVRADVPNTVHMPGGQKRAQWNVYAYQDIPITESVVTGKYVTAGAVLVAEDEFDAATILTEVLWNKGLLARSVCVSPESMEKVHLAMPHVVPLSLYMCTE